MAGTDRNFAIKAANPPKGYTARNIHTSSVRAFCTTRLATGKHEDQILLQLAYVILQLANDNMGIKTVSSS